jgi:hypothetical protein
MAFAGQARMAGHMGELSQVFGSMWANLFAI